MNKGLRWLTRHRTCRQKATRRRRTSPQKPAISQQKQACKILVRYLAYFLFNVFETLWMKQKKFVRIARKRHVNVVRANLTRRLNSCHIKTPPVMPEGFLYVYTADKRVYSRHNLIVDRIGEVGKLVSVDFGAGRRADKCDFVSRAYIWYMRYI